MLSYGICSLECTLNFSINRARTSNIRFETEMAERGCMVHIFDPSGRVKEYLTSASRGQKSNQQHGSGKNGDIPKNLIFHKTTLDWRDTNLDSRDKLSWRPSKLSAIMKRLGHDTVRITPSFVFVFTFIISYTF